MAPRNEPADSMLSFERGDYTSRGRLKWLVLNRSPLARKIILFNLIALGILVSGVLYLNQAQDAQLDVRSNILTQQAEMITSALKSHEGDPNYDDIQGEIFQDFFISLVFHTDSIVQVYGDTGQVEFMYIPRPSTKTTVTGDADAFTGALQKIWASISAPISGLSPELDEENLHKQLVRLASVAMATNDRTKSAIFSVGGEIYIAVALPITGPDGVKGAILLSTRRGEIDKIIRDAREQILQVFLLATLSSIILSMVLANSIARPLRRLSAAAQSAHDDAGGKINIARINIPDLTARPDEIGDLSRSMRNMTEALLDQVDENKSFAADVAHEIKNPLTSLRSAVETLGYVEDDESQKMLLEVIQSDVGRLDRLVTDISNASRLDAELVRDRWEDVEICKLLTLMCDSFLQRDKYPDVDIQLSINTENCVVRGLETRLEQVFSNLISNALSFAAKDGLVQVSIVEVGDKLEIRVSDDGPGIPKANLEDVFSRFYSERPASQFGEHSGLGLAISRQIIDAHGGTLVAQNNDAGGALFIVTLT